MNRRNFITKTAGGFLCLAAGAFGDLRLDAPPGLCTLALQKAIDECHQRGGGTVLIPAGRYMAGTIRLRSFVALELEEGAVLLGSPRAEDYPEQPAPAGGPMSDGVGRRALIYAEGEQNIGIFGRGCVDGQGEHFVRQDGRPRLIQFVRCRDVRVEGLRLRNSAVWMQHYLECENVQIRGLNVWNHANHNNDMMDIDGCRSVTVSDCIGDSDDDGITLKSTGPAPCENVVVSNCVVSSHCNALKCGTESCGGFRNILFSNCVVKPSAVRTRINGNVDGLSGLSLEIVDGGAMDGVEVSNVMIEGTLAPIFIRLGARNRPYRHGAPTPTTGSVRNIRITDLIARRAGNIGCSITGLPGHPVENVTLRGVRIELAESGEAKDVGRVLAERERSYPEEKMWGRLPACGFYIRHAAQVRFDDVAIVPAPGEPRPPVVMSDVTDSTGLPGK